MTKPVPTFEKITPAQAKAWLDDPKVNHSNRTLRQDHVRFLAKEMAEGRWEPNNDAICFAKDGRLLNGQHRLSAIVLSGKPQELFVIRGMDEESFKVMDGGGLVRANHERIHLVNEFTANHNICKAIRTFLYEVGTANHKISVGEIEDEFLKKSDAWTWIGTEAVGMNSRLKKASIMAAFGIYRHVKPEKAAIFLDGYKTGVGLTQESPIMKLRNMALLGDHRDTTYWNVMSVLRAHLQGRPLTKVYPASVDLDGNKNSADLIQERSQRSLKGAQTRKKRQQGQNGQNGDAPAA